MNTITFPEYTGVRCLMMPYIQGAADSVPDDYAGYRSIVASLFLERGAIGFLTIDESVAVEGNPHRGARAKFERALHTEAGIDHDLRYRWGGGPRWGGGHRVTLDRDVEILIASNVDGSCTVWDAVHEDTSIDGDIGDRADLYPYEAATFLKAGEIARIGILTPHESLPVARTVRRQFLRIVGAGVYGREPYFTENPLVPHAE